MADPALAEKLAQLRDIHLPDPVGFWPPAVGWWLLLLAALLLLLFGCVRLLRRHGRRLYRREALRDLREALADYYATGDRSAYLMRVAVLLKRVAITAFGRAAGASLTGEDWVALLDRTGRTREFSLGAGQVLMFGQYSRSPELDPEALHRLLCQWVRRHRAEELYAR